LTELRFTITLGTKQIRKKRLVRQKKIYVIIAEESMGDYEAYIDISIRPFLVAYQNLTGRCFVYKHGSHVINIPKADWSSVKNKQLTATPC